MRRGGAPLPLGELVQRARRAAGEVAAGERGEIRTFFCGACGVTPVGPRPDVCRGCTRNENLVEVEKRRAERLRIPPCFWWARLDLEPFSPEVGGPRVASAEAVRRVRAFRGELLTLRGPTGQAKSALAAAWLMARAAEGKTAAFIECALLSPDAPDQDLARHLERLAMDCRAVVLDDIGKELGGAQEAGHLSAVRSASVRRLVEHFYRHRGSGAHEVLFTCGFKDSEIARAYGGDFLRRMSPDLDSKRPGTDEFTLGGWK